MSKPQQGVSAEELREAAREANAAMKDLQAATKEARAAKEELNRAADGYADRVIAGINEALAMHRGVIEAEIRAVAKQAVDGIGVAIHEKTMEMRAALNEKLSARPALGAMMAEAFGEGPAPLLARPEGVSFTVNGKDIVQAMPCDTTGMKISAGMQWPERAPRDVERKCYICKRQCWVTPAALAAHNAGAELWCVVCTSVLLKKAREAGGQEILSADGRVWNGGVL